MNEDKTAIIRALNDEFRKTGIGGQILMTQGVKTLGANKINDVGLTVREFDDFTDDSDPYGEHDFGAFEIDGQTLFWKVDYYAKDMIHGSENPTDPDVTVRILTIMLASEY